MKIMIIQHYGGVGGGTNSCIDVAKILKRMGHNITIAISSPTSEVQSICEEQGVPIIEVPPVVQLNYHSASGSVFSSLVKMVLSYRWHSAWRRFFDQLEIDVVVLNDSTPLPMANMIKKAGMKCLCTIRETCREKNDSIWNNIIRHFAKNLDAVAFLTNFDKSRWSFPNTVHQYVLPDVVDTDRYTLSESPSEVEAGTNEAVTFLYLGGFSYSKGALDLIKAFGKVISAGHRAYLYILGDTFVGDRTHGIRSSIKKGQYKFVAQCLQSVEQINKEHKYIFLEGRKKDVSQWYQKSDVIIFPVKDVHQARPVYEAGLYRKPVIVPDYDNFEESVVNSVNGLTYFKNDIDSLAEKMIQFIKAPNLIKELGINNESMYKKSHTIEYAQSVLEEILVDLK